MADLLQAWRNDENQNMPDNLDEYKITDEVLKIFCQQTASWTFLETISLLSGYNPMWRDEIKASAKCPENVLTKAMGRCQVRDIGNEATLQVAKKTKYLTKLLESAIDIKELNPQINDKQEQIFKPIDIILWAESKGIQLPNGIGDLVKKHTKGYVDFEDEYTKLLQENEKLKETLEPLHGSTKNSYLQMIRGLVKSVCKCDNLNAQNINEMFLSIENELDSKGESLNTETIQNILNEAIGKVKRRNNKNKNRKK